MTGRILTIFLLLSYVNCFAPLATAKIITNLSAAHVRVMRGDIVQLSVTTKNPLDQIQWWHESKQVCSAADCTVNTSDFSPGEYIYDVVVINDEGAEVGSVSVAAEAAPPLYRPQAVSPPVDFDANRITSIKTGEWILIARAGLVNSFVDGKPDSTRHVTSIAALSASHNLDRTFSVASSSQAVVRRVGYGEEWFFPSGSSFAVNQNHLSILSGQAIWRRSASHRLSPTTVFLGSPSKALSEHSLHQMTVSATGSLFLTLDISSMSKIVVHHIEGQDVKMTCAKELTTIKSSSTYTFTLLDKTCRANRSEPEDPTHFVETWSPWWMGTTPLQSTDRWRLEWNLSQSQRSTLTDHTVVIPDIFKQSDEPLVEAVSFSCADFLDSLALNPDFNEGELAAQKAKNYCLYSLRMLKHSTFTLRDLYRSQHANAWSAYMLGMTLQSMNKDRQALVWFEESRRNRFKHMEALCRAGLQSADNLGSASEILYWLEACAEIPTDDTSFPSQLVPEDSATSAAIWGLYRPTGGRLEGALYMDSQAFPVNAQVSSPLPGGAQASRSLVAKTDGQWWRTIEFNSRSHLRFSGSHNLTVPMQSNTSFASSSIHDLSVGITIGETNSRHPDLVSAWTASVGGVLGTGFSGSHRQRDHFGGFIGTSHLSWYGFNLKLASDKYLDPSPNGSDVIELDLYRYVGPADHSHEDLTVTAGFHLFTTSTAWTLILGAGTVDFRTGILDAYDYSWIRANVGSTWRIAPKIELDLKPSYFARTYKGSQGTDVTASMPLTLFYHLTPLWCGGVIAGFESRAVSTDPSSSWTRMIYGLTTIKEL